MSTASEFTTKEMVVLVKERLPELGSTPFALETNQLEGSRVQITSDVWRLSVQVTTMHVVKRHPYLTSSWEMARRSKVEPAADNDQIWFRNIGDGSFSISRLEASQMTLESVIALVKEKYPPNKYFAVGLQCRVTATSDTFSLLTERSSGLLVRPGRDPVLPIEGPHVMIRTFDGETFPLVAGLLDTVKTVKLRIQDIKGANTNEQRLFFLGKELNDSRTLRRYKVQCGSILQLFGRYSCGV
ncbi:ubiquitin family protein [Moniliophthora roreri]|nr:ubiquitin family protein [Moniliophthora roreri]